jgi:hypothetical protein
VTRKAKVKKGRERQSLSLTAVLTESGYRYAVPTCRTILALDMHHIWEAFNAVGGFDEMFGAEEAGLSSSGSS